MLHLKRVGEPRKEVLWEKNADTVIGLAKADIDEV